MARIAASEAGENAMRLDVLDDVVPPSGIMSSGTISNIIESGKIASKVMRSRII